MSNSTPTSEHDPIVQRWLTALLQFDPTLPRPIADAMVRNVDRGPLGNSLRQLDGHLMELESIRVEDLAGSEARTILAVLIQMNHRVAELQAKIHQLWNTPS